MLTTATPSRTLGPSRAAGVVVRTVVPVAGAVVVLGVAGALVGGTPAALGALAGGLLIVLVLTSSTLLVDLAASLANASVLLVGLVTYSLHVLLVLVALIAVQRSGLTDDGTLSAPWLGGAVVLGALVWSAAQVVATSRARIPLYDLPERASEESGRAGDR